MNRVDFQAHGVASSSTWSAPALRPEHLAHLLLSSTGLKVVVPFLTVHCSVSSFARLVLVARCSSSPNPLLSQTLSRVGMGRWQYIPNSIFGAEEIGQSWVWVLYSITECMHLNHIFSLPVSVPASFGTFLTTSLHQSIHMTPAWIRVPATHTYPNSEYFNLKFLKVGEKCHSWSQGIES